MDKMVQLYMQRIMTLHGILVSIVSNRDSQFTSRFWNKVQEALATKLEFSMVFHPQTDGQTERVNQILEDMLRACVLEFKGNWDGYLHLVEFAYNNSYQPAKVWLHLKHCTVKVADHQSFGWKMVKGN